MGRIYGVITLLAAALVLFLVPRALDPGVGGVALRAPLPAPPPVGTCIDVGSIQQYYYGSYPPLFQEFKIVECKLPHDLEVTRTWTAAQVDQQPEILNDGIACTASLAQYAGLPSQPLLDHWFISGFSTNSWLIGAPPSQRAGPLGWKVCVVQVVDRVGSVQNLWAQSERPAGFGTCWVSADPVFCNMPHNRETLGTASSAEPNDPSVQIGDAPPLPGPDALVSECNSLADVLMSRADPTYAGQLAVAMSYDKSSSELWRDTNQDGKYDPSETVNGTLIEATCSITTSDGSMLIDSLLGVGDKPLPVQ